MSFSKDEALVVKNAFLSAAAALDSKKDWINELNVFPVPDGDTGTNMTLTIMNAANEVAGLEDADMETICKAIRNGSLRGARGNSGVITSQLLSGFTKGILECGSISVGCLSKAMHRAVETAYKAVMKPKEGTILTVARAMSDEAGRVAPECRSIREFMGKLVAAGNDMLAKTPEMLPVLKQAGVVDAGGQGLMVMMQGALDSLRGNTCEFKGLTGSNAASNKVAAASNDIDTADIKYAYCTEFFILGHMNDSQVAEFKAYLESIGDSIVVVADEDIVKVHVHNNQPGNVFQKAMQYGELSHGKIDNMREEHRELLTKAPAAEPVPRKEAGVVTVAVGEGFASIFTELGADCIIQGGQTMNPSAEDIVRAIEEANAETVYVLPNNKNIILAAKQAAEIVDDCEVVVIPTKSICQGIVALFNLDKAAPAEDNLNNITGIFSEIITNEVTYAVRDTQLDGFDIKANDKMVIGDNGMVAVNVDLNAAILEALDREIDDDIAMVTLYYGSDITKSDAENLVKNLEERFPDVEFSLNYGGQPVYFYMLCLER